MSLLSTAELIQKKQRVGLPIKKLEGPKLLVGLGGFTEDIQLGDQHYVSLLRSPYAHARIKSIDTSKCDKMPGVRCTLTGRDALAYSKPIKLKGRETSHYILATDKVRYMGEPIAAVVAKDKYIAEDALELIDVEYERLPVVCNVEQAMKKDAPLIYESVGTNVLAHDHFDFGDLEGAFARADAVVKQRLRIHRYASLPLEPYIVNASYDRARDELLVYATAQRPGSTIPAVATTLGIPENRIRLIVPPIGGGFGNKGGATWQYLSILGLASKMCGKPVKWVQTRMESMYGPHRADGFLDAQFALASDGRVLGMKLVDHQADGNWPFMVGHYSIQKFANMVGPYKIRNYSFEYNSCATNKPPVTPDRGVSKPFMCFVLERMMSFAAKKIGMSEIDIRYRNFIQPEDHPYTATHGEVYESGNYPATLRKALEAIDYQSWLVKQRELRNEGRLVGIGVSCGVEPGSSNVGYYSLGQMTPSWWVGLGAGEVGMVEIDIGGRLRALTSSTESGQGHSTTLAQAVADIFDVRPEDVLVEPNFDSFEGYTTYTGTFSNHFNDINVGAVLRAAETLKAKVIRIAAKQLGVPAQELELRNGSVCSKFDGNQKSISIAEVANIAYRKFILLPPGDDPGLRSFAGYQNTSAKYPRRTDFNIQLTHGNSAHVAVVEIDKHTGNVHFLRYVIAHDAGHQINPAIVEGMVLGSTASGIGGALYEEFVFNEDCLNLCLTFSEYSAICASNIPDIHVESLETPAPNTVLGTKACGEGGAITSLAAVTGAVEDAIGRQGVELNELPLTPEKIWRLISTSN